MPDYVTRDNVRFLPIEPADMRDSVGTIAQGVDDQWVPDTLLKKILSEGLSLSEVSAERDRMARGEYLRALVSSTQVVVNRAYFANNPVLYRDYLPESPERDSFKELLGDGTIVPFLLDESSPVSEGTGFDPDPIGWQAWRDVVTEVAPSCLRLSWNDQDNRERGHEQLWRRFHNRLGDFSTLGAEYFASALGVDVPVAERIRLRFCDVAAFCLDLSRQAEIATRAAVYREFVIRPRTATAAGFYDPDKQFSGELKRYVDLVYNANLADALESYVLTPTESLPRTALHEAELQRRGRVWSDEEMTDVLRRLTFDAVHAALHGGEFMRSFNELTLADVRRLRQEQVWHSYADRLRTLLGDPLRFGDPDRGALPVVMAYCELMRKATEIAVGRRADRRRAQLAEWIPQVCVVLQFAGGLIKICYPAGDQYVDIVTDVAAGFLKKTTPIVVSLLIEPLDRRRSQARLDGQISLVRGRITGAQHLYQQILDGRFGPVESGGRRRQSPSLAGEREEEAD